MMKDAAEGWARTETMKRKITVSYVDSDPDLTVADIAAGIDLIVRNDQIKRVEVKTLVTVTHTRK